MHIKITVNVLEAVSNGNCGESIAGEGILWDTAGYRRTAPNQSSSRHES
jgi:hypothetical protein